MRLLKSIAMTLFAFSSIAWSQEKQSRNIEFKISSPVILHETNPLYFPTSPLPTDGSEYSGKWATVALNAYMAEGPYEARVLDSLSFFSKPNASSDVVGTAKIPSSGNKLIMLLMANKEKKKYQCLVASHDKAAWGGYYLVNKSPNLVMIQIGDSKKIIKPGKAASLRPKEGTNLVRIYTGSPKKPEIARTTKWFIESEKREFVIFYGSPLKSINITDKKPRSASL